MSDQLRAALESSFAAAEKEEVVEVRESPVAPPPSGTEQQSESVAAPASTTVDPVVPSSEEGSTVTPDDKPKSITEVVAGAVDGLSASAESPVPATQDSALPEINEQKLQAKIDQAPATWKGDAKEVWKDLPLNVRQEVLRREMQTAKVLTDTELDRRKVQEITQVLSPHMDRIGANYQGNPLTAINNLLETERILTVGTPLNKAQLVANIIQQFGIDIMTLDGILSGSGVPENVRQQATQQSEIEKLLDQRLAPVMSYVQQQEAARQEAARTAETRVQETVESMSLDPKYPYFDDVRADMADLIELSSKRGVDLSLEEAYNRAVRMNGHTVQAMETRTSAQAVTQTALQAHQEAQKAKGAAVSVSGSPSHTSGLTVNPADLRSLISSQFDNRGERI
jgi:uncharacterized protein (UPF0147 family)